MRQGVRLKSDPLGLSWLRTSSPLYSTVRVRRTLAIVSDHLHYCREQVPEPQGHHIRSGEALPSDVVTGGVSTILCALLCACAGQARTGSPAPVIRQRGGPASSPQPAPPPRLEQPSAKTICPPRQEEVRCRLGGASSSVADRLAAFGCASVRRDTVLALPGVGSDLIRAS